VIDLPMFRFVILFVLGFAKGIKPMGEGTSQNVGLGLFYYKLCEYFRNALFFSFNFFRKKISLENDEPFDDFFLTLGKYIFPRLLQDFL
jgi:hypothetical protein